MTFKKEKSHTETTGKNPPHFPQDFQLCIISSSQLYCFCQYAYAAWLQGFSFHIYKTKVTTASKRDIADLKLTVLLNLWWRNVKINKFQMLQLVGEKIEKIPFLCCIVFMSKCYNVLYSMVISSVIYSMVKSVSHHLQI